MSADDRRWLLFNASPDIRAQIESFPPLHPSSDARRGRRSRSVPLQAVLLTDAELDYTLGLLLREGCGLELHATGTPLIFRRHPDRPRRAGRAAI